ncbi:hypothetical protein K438DRAFT_1989133 [Mycena galopus ATCC 62051]|nr:hypothetical protein K438DRAFT_1989133 [Mycena galopus ATCC 62051]
MYWPYRLPLRHLLLHRRRLCLLPLRAFRYFGFLRAFCTLCTFCTLLGLRAVAVSDGDGSRLTGTGPVRQATKYYFVTDGYGTGRPVNGNTRLRPSTGDGCQQTCVGLVSLEP